MRVCFYINVKLNVDRWSIDFVSFDVCTIKLKIARDDAQRSIHIHNVYNAFLISYSFLETINALATMKRLLQDDAKHILLDDFKLHHSFWSRSARLTQHVVVDQLIDLINVRHMQLCLSQDIIIWEARNSFSIIDLIFMISRLHASMTYCENRRDLD